MAEPIAVFIVAPFLTSPEGHEFEHTQEIARAVKRRHPAGEVIVFSGPQNERLAAALQEQRAIDAAHACFARRDLWDGARPAALARGAFLNALDLRRALARFPRARPVLFLDSFDIHRVLMLAAVRALRPARPLPAIAIARHDPLYASGELKGKYRFLRDHAVGRVIVRRALRRTVVATDSVVLREVLSSRLGVHARLAPLVLPGLWQMEGAGRGASAHGPATVAFVGQPRRDRAFELFVAAAKAMEAEREAGALRFLVVAPPGSLERVGMAHHREFLESGAAGIAFEERWMDSCAFAREIARGDVVWALCDPADYYLRQTSGIFSYGFGLGCRVLTNRGWAESAAGATPACRFVDPRLDQVVPAIRALARTADDAGGTHALWRAAHSRAAFDTFVDEALAEASHG